ncbi:MAG: hypothetical protein ACK4WF_01000, partial [Candidatus Brocadiales bacterium]
MRQWSLPVVLVVGVMMLGVAPCLAQAPAAPAPVAAAVAADLPQLNVMWPSEKEQKAWREFVGLEMGDGPYRSLYKPIPMHMYIAPTRHYIRPDMSGFAELFKKFKPDQCEECHLEVTPGWVHQWEDSVHANPRKTPYNAQRTAEIEKLLGRSITKVGCAECHGSSHDKLKMPFLENACGHCHKQQMEEFVSEKKDGRPSHFACWQSEVVPPWYIE